MKPKSWKYYTRQGYTCRFDTSKMLGCGIVYVNYCWERPDENPTFQQVGSFRVYGHQTKQDWQEIHKRCAEMAQRHVEWNQDA